MKFTLYATTVDAFLIPEITGYNDPRSESGAFIEWMDKAGVPVDTTNYSSDSLRSGKRPYLKIRTPNGETVAYPGDWIVQDAQGDF